MKAILQLEWVRYVLVGLIGIAIGAIFYPSKTITTEETREFEQKITRLEAQKESITSIFENQLSLEKQQSRKYQEQVTKKLDVYKEENYKLKQKVSEKRFKIVRPDGTIEEKWFKESETDVVSSTVTKIKSEFTRKVKSIENKWMTIHKKRVEKIKADYEKKIAESTHTKEKTHKKKVVEINKRNFGISGGIMTDKKYFGGVTYDIFGPLFLDLHLESDRSFQNKEVGLGIGIRF